MSFLGILLKLLGFGKTISGLFKLAFHWLLLDIRNPGLIALIIFSLWWRHDALDLRASLSATQTELAAEQTAHLATIADYAAAQQAATALALDVKTTTETGWKENANAAQSRTRSRLDAALLELGRLRTTQTAPVSGTPCHANPAAPAASPAPADGAGSLPIMDDRDLLTCTANTVKAQEWQSFWQAARATLESAAEGTPAQ